MGAGGGLGVPLAAARWMDDALASEDGRGVREGPEEGASPRVREKAFVPSEKGAGER